MIRKNLLSEIAYKIEGRASFKVLDRVKKLERAGENIIHFEIGDPDFNTPNHIIEAAYSSMKNGETHYTGYMGLYDLREAAAEATLNSRGFKPAIEQILVTPGANIIIYLAIKCLVNPGEEVIIPDPGFPTYSSAVKLCEAIPVRVPLLEKNGFRMNPDDVRKAVTPKTRLIIINSPNNPTGSVMTPEELDEVYKIAEDNGIYLFSDEVYSRMMYGETKFYSPSSNDKCMHTTILTNGFSKAFAMTGWRLGVAIGPKEIIEKMGLLIQNLCSCVPPFVQRGGIAAIKGDQSEIKKMMEIYKERRDLLVEELNKIPGISCLKPEGAFYVFCNITKTGMTSEKFAEFILEEAKVSLLPGTSFGPHGEGYARLAYANSIENIKEGLRRIHDALSKKHTYGKNLMEKIKVAIIGTGNIGTDLLIKIQRSEILECRMFTGVNPDSEGIKKARTMAVPTSCKSIKAIEENPDCCQIVFDATSASSHFIHAPILKKLNKYVIDLTPSQVGRMCVPVLNLEECLHESNVNLITCGGQAITPIACAIMKVHPETEYIEVVSTISSKSAGAGTRANIDEYTQATKDAIILFSGVPKAKAIILLNPAEPPVIMHNTLYVIIKEPKIDELKSEIMLVAKKIQKYVPNYRISLGPVFENGRLTTMVEVLGCGDFLPKFAGNLDIITSAAINIAEEYAKANLRKINHE